jgi:hypothetical protein
MIFDFLFRKKKESPKMEKKEQKTYKIVEKFDEESEYHILLSQVLDDIRCQGFSIPKSMGAYVATSWSLEENGYQEYEIKKKASPYSEVIVRVVWKDEDGVFVPDRINFHGNSFKWRRWPSLHRHMDVIYDMYAAIEHEKDALERRRFDDVKKKVDSVVSLSSKRDGIIDSLLGDDQ